MVLFSIDEGGIPQRITRVPHQAQYQRWRNRLSEPAFRSICNELLDRIIEGEVHTSSWIPGSEWANTPFMPIYETACLKDVGDAAKCFGLILWEVMMKHPESWSFGRYEKDGTPIEGLTYFRISLEGGQEG